MLQLQPVTGHLVARERAHAVVAPPYDALSPTERATLAASDPDSYLGALPGGSETTDLDRVLRRCRDHLGRLFAAGRFRPLPGPSLLVLALGSGPGRAVAVVGDVEVAAYTDGQVQPHEAVGDTRTEQLARYLEIVGVSSSPVAVTQRPHPGVDDATAPILATVPDVAYRTGDGPEVTDVAVWVVADPDRRAALAAAVGAAGPVFLADGHHRAAAAARHLHRLGPDAPPAARRVLTAVLPSDHLGVLPFHRLVPVTAHLDAAELAARLRRRGFRVADLPGPTRPARSGEWSVVVHGTWLRVTDGAGSPAGDDLVEGLDVRRFERDLLPALRDDDQGDAPVSVADPLGLAALDVAGTIGVALHPPDLETVLRVAGSGRTVPPKTTYIVPKLRSGLLVTPRGPQAPAPPPPGPAGRPQ